MGVRIGTGALALIAFLIAWLVFEAPIIGLIIAVIIVVGGLSINTGNPWRSGRPRNR